jgi:hypothetical protein
MYWNFVAIDGVIKNQINMQQDATLKGKNIEIIYQQILNEGTTFHNKLWVFSLLFVATLHVSAYKQAIFRCL